MPKSLPGILLLTACLAGCATPPLGESRANTAVDPAYMVGPAHPDWDTPPKLIHGKAPVYPVSRLVAGQDGRTIIAYTIGSDGKPGDFEVVETDDKVFADHAIIAVRTWRYQPATKGGAAISARVEHPFVYSAR